MQVDGASGGPKPFCGVSSFVATTALAPLERLKMVLQTGVLHGQVSSTQASLYGRVMESLVTTQGAKNLWRGNLANLIRVMPTTALRFSTQNFYQRLLFPDAKRSNPVPFAITGALSGMTALTILYPVDLLRTKMAADVGNPPQYRSTLDCFRQTLYGEDYSNLRRHGHYSGPRPALGWQNYRRLYKGLTISLLEIAPYTASFFAIFNFLDSNIKDTGPKGLTLKAMAGATAGLSGSLLAYPIDTIRRRLMINPSQSSGARGFQRVLREVLAGEGFVGLYRGLGVNLIRSLPNSALVWMVYSRVKMHLDPELAERAKEAEEEFLRSRKQLRELRRAGMEQQRRMEEAASRSSRPGLDNSVSLRERLSSDPGTRATRDRGDGYDDHGKGFIPAVPVASDDDSGWSDPGFRDDFQDQASLEEAWEEEESWIVWNDPEDHHGPSR